MRSAYMIVVAVAGYGACSGSILIMMALSSWSGVAILAQGYLLNLGPSHLMAFPTHPTLGGHGGVIFPWLGLGWDFRRVAGQGRSRGGGSLGVTLVHRWGLWRPCFSCAHASCLGAGCLVAILMVHTCGQGGRLGCTLCTRGCQRWAKPAHCWPLGPLACVWPGARWSVGYIK